MQKAAANDRFGRHEAQIFMKNSERGLHDK
jgi:hypothetical protein